MHNYNKIIISCTALMLALCNCSSGDEYSRNATGKITLAVEADKTITQSVVSRATTPNMPVLSSLTADKLTLSLTSQSGEYYDTWPSRNEFPAEEEFPADTYTMTASYGNTAAEGFESPQLYGEATFPVVAGKVTPVKLTAKVANSLVMFEPTENFLNYFHSARFVLNSAAGNSLVVNPGETRPVYINPGNASIDARVIMPSGADALITIGSFTARKATLHRITLDVEASTGTATLTISFDETITDIKPIIIDLTEELFTAPAPVVTPEGFEGNRAIQLIETHTDDYAFNIATRAGLASAKITITDNNDTPQSYDLLNADDHAALEKIGLRTLNLKPGLEFSKIYMRDLISSMRCADRENPSNKEISLSVTDRLGRTTDETLADNNTFKINLSPVTLSIEAVKDVVVHPTYQVKVRYNGSDIEKQLKFNTISKNGTKYSISDQKPQKVDGKDDEFIYTFKTPYREDNNKTNEFSNFKVEGGLTNADGVSTDNLAETGSIVIPEYKATIDSRDIWARKATITITPKSGYDQYKDLIADALVISGIGAEHIENRNGNRFIVDVKDLEPDTDYDIAFSLNGYNPIHKVFTTEKPLQLPNADMEDWYKEDGKTSNWWIEYPSKDTHAIWGTMNLLTTSQGGSRNNTASGSAYCAFSGTRKTTDKHNGEYAAIISTVGWGNGNTAWRDQIATGSVLGVPNGGKCEHLTVGELYLGTYNSEKESPDYSGYNFSSRPSSMSFYHKYVKKNSADWGIAEIKVLDEHDNIIAKGSAQLTSASYSQTTIDLKYNDNALSAKKIIVIFKSSGNPNCQTINNDNLSSPPSTNLSDGRYTGSELFIDDIKLNYD